MQLMYEGAYLDIIVQEATGRLTGIDWRIDLGKRGKGQ
jgi:hypothetical protein